MGAPRRLGYCDAIKSDLEASVSHPASSSAIYHPQVWLSRACRQPALVPVFGASSTVGARFLQKRQITGRTATSIPTDLARSQDPLVVFSQQPIGPSLLSWTARFS